MNQLQEQLQQSYDRVAADYAEHFRDEMSQKPFDRKTLDLLIKKVADLGTICDLGCGPGQIAGYLSDKGAEVCGIDLSARMVEQAKNQLPHIFFRQGDMLALNDVDDESFGGVTAFYSIIHVPRGQVGKALREINRVLVPKGVLLLTFHIGSETQHLDVWWEKPVDLDFHFFETAEMKYYLTKSGFTLEEVFERDPLPEIEVQTRRAYLFARKSD